jgi:hypothetical protein
VCVCVSLSFSSFSCIVGEIWRLSSALYLVISCSLQEVPRSSIACFVVSHAACLGDDACTIPSTAGDAKVRNGVHTRHVSGRAVIVWF